MRSLFVLLLLFLWGQSYAEQIFLLYDGACGAQLRYQRTVADSPRMDYYSYSLPAGFGMRIMLETDGEGAAVQQQLPEGYLQCSDARLTTELADRINEAQDHFFIVQPLAEGGYRIEPVVMAAVMEEMGTSIRYRSPFAVFAFDTENSVIGINLDNGNEGATVTFEGMEGQGCQASYLLRQYNPGAAYPYIVYRLVPGLGIVERQLTGDGRSNQDETIAASQVDDLPLADYLEAQCANRQREVSFVPLYIDAQAESGQSVTESSKPVISSPAAKVVPVSTSTVETVDLSETQLPVTEHEVARGETLYAIARRYGVSVEDIKRNNGLRDNTIFVGQRLRIDSDAAVAEPVVADPIVEERPLYSPPVRVPANEPTPDPIVAVPGISASSADYAGSDYHIVQPGETFASLALRYGYTTQRFKAFNNLSDAQVARVGQRLKTTDCTCPTVSEDPVQPGGGNPMPEPPRPSDYVTGTPTPPAPVRNEAAYPSYYPPPPVVAPAPNVIAPAATPVEHRPQAGTSPAYASPPPPAYGAPVQQNRAIHIVQEGDSLYGIARQYRLTVEELRTLNALESADVIVPYQKLYVN
ncbi:LysM peptidoglycan-binding domain-containing protein [Neolewinella litorea]|uniref:LysM peptidoglycan-binding domain-containing protein n=1 Tax=Neolewinella litorea TaxID=2562452 RepID=A0A4S4NQ64_9BACT|nr:LysM peptidoglycan-binding domain-containing protein [Neolewinella litorea]THH41255.1 LysM peptidoglycan-binding domain-containing protein [Neolewinella litorea]